MIPEKTKKEPEYNVVKAVKSKAQQMKEILENQKQVMVMIPLEKGEPSNAKQSFCINGYNISYPKGTMVAVPEQIAEMIAERYKIDLNIRKASLEYANDETKKALN